MNPMSADGMSSNHIVASRSIKIPIAINRVSDNALITFAETHLDIALPIITPKKMMEVKPKVVINILLPFSELVSNLSL